MLNQQQSCVSPLPSKESDIYGHYPTNVSPKKNQRGPSPRQPRTSCGGSTAHHFQSPSSTKGPSPRSSAHKRPPSPLNGENAGSKHVWDPVVKQAQIQTALSRASSQTEVELLRYKVDQLERQLLEMKKSEQSMLTDYENMKLERNAAKSQAAQIYEVRVENDALRAQLTSLKWELDRANLHCEREKAERETETKELERRLALEQSRVNEAVGREKSRGLEVKRVEQDREADCERYHRREEQLKEEFQRERDDREQEREKWHRKETERIAELEQIHLQFQKLYHQQEQREQLQESIEEERDQLTELRIQFTLDNEKLREERMEDKTQHQQVTAELENLRPQIKRMEETRQQLQALQDQHTVVLKDMQHEKECARQLRTQAQLMVSMRGKQCSTYLLCIYFEKLRRHALERTHARKQKQMQQRVEHITQLAHDLDVPL